MKKEIKKQKKELKKESNKKAKKSKKQEKKESKIEIIRKKESSDEEEEEFFDDDSPRVIMAPSGGDATPVLERIGQLETSMGQFIPRGALEGDEEGKDTGYMPKNGTEYHSAKTNKYLEANKLEYDDAHSVRSMTRANPTDSADLRDEKERDLAFNVGMDVEEANSHDKYALKAERLDEEPKSVFEDEARKYKGRRI